MRPMPSQALRTTKPTTSADQRAMFALMADRYKAQVGAAIRARRKALGLTQADLAERCHVEQSQTVSRWERGLNLPSDLSVAAEALETTLPDLFAGIKPPDARAARKAAIAYADPQATALATELTRLEQLEPKVDQLLQATANAAADLRRLARLVAGIERQLREQDRQPPAAADGS